MESTLLRAGRTTHLKIVAVAVLASVAVVVVAVNARTEQLSTIRSTADSIVVKAGQPSTYASQASTIR